MINLKSVKTQLILYLLILAVFLIVKDKDAAFLSSALVAVASAVILDALFLSFRKKAPVITESAVITGLIIGYVLSSDEALWKFIFAAALAIASKHFIRSGKKHIFNPAAFGLFFTVILLNASTQWRATYIWYILVPFGIYFAQRIRKLEVISGYAVASFLLFGVQAVLNGVPVLHIFGYFNYFYVFVMVIEPKTTPLKPAGKYIFGLAVAVLIFIMTEIGARFDVELFSLLAMNVTVPLLNRIQLKKGGKA